MKHSRYTVCMDDASKLTGYSIQEFIGTRAVLQEYRLLMIYQESGGYTNINFQRVRWYAVEPMPEQEPSS